jgi:hypothetical protein
MLSLGGNPADDIVVADQNTTEVWSLRHNQFHTSPLIGFTLAPGEEKTFQEQWPLVDNQLNPVAPGDYAAWALVTLESPWVLKSLPSHISVVP